MSEGNKAPGTECMTLGANCSAKEDFMETRVSVRAV